MKTSQTYMSNRCTGIVKKLTKERTVEMQQRRAMNMNYTKVLTSHTFGAGQVMNVHVEAEDVMITSQIIKDGKADGPLLLSASKKARNLQQHRLKAGAKGGTVV